MFRRRSPLLLIAWFLGWPVIAPAQDVPILQPRMMLYSGQPPEVDNDFAESLAVSDSAIVIGDGGRFIPDLGLGTVYVFDPQSGELRFQLQPEVQEGDTPRKKRNPRHRPFRRNVGGLGKAPMQPPILSSLCSLRQKGLCLFRSSVSFLPNGTAVAIAGQRTRQSNVPRTSRQRKTLLN